MPSVFSRFTVCANHPSGICLSIGQPLVCLSAVHGFKRVVSQLGSLPRKLSRSEHKLMGGDLAACPVDPIQAITNRLFIYSELSVPDRIGIELFTQSLDSKSPLRIRLSRPLNETISRFFERLSSSLFVKKKHRESESSSPIECTLYQCKLPPVNECRPPQLEKIEPFGSTIGEVFSAIVNEEPDAAHAVYLLIHSETDVLYKASFNPARILKCRFEIWPMVDCPVVPRLEASNMDIEQTEFAWFVTKVSFPVFS